MKTRSIIDKSCAVQWNKINAKRQLKWTRMRLSQTLVYWKILSLVSLLIRMTMCGPPHVMPIVDYSDSTKKRDATKCLVQSRQRGSSKKQGHLRRSFHVHAYQSSLADLKLHPQRDVLQRDVLPPHF